MPHPAAVPNPHDIARLRLPNGITLLARHNPSSPSIVLTGILPIGSLCDPPGQEGLAEMTSATLMSGTARYDEERLYERLEFAGANFGYTNSMELTAFRGKALSEDFDLLLETLTETLFTPAFPRKHIDRLRVDWFSYLQERLYEISEVAFLHLRRRLYGSHPYHRDGNGSLESAQRISRQTVLNFHRQRFGPQGCIIAVVGGIPPQEALERTARALEDWRNPAQPPPPQVPLQVPPPADTAPQRIPVPDARRSVVAVGATGLPVSHPDHLSLQVANDILTSFGMQGRLGQVLREEHNLVYSVNGGLTGLNGPGAWTFSCTTAPQNAPRALELLYAELERLRSQPVSPQELDDSISGILGAEAFRFSGNYGVALSLLELERLGHPLDFYARLPGLVRAITAEDVQRVAYTLLAPERLAAVVAVPADNAA